ncbi:MAG: hypothetical protein AB1607_14485 [Chloroflexota bacterium]
MNVIYKYILQHKNQIFYSFAAIVCALGAYLAWIMVDKYEYAVDGILGFVALYLLYLILLSPKRIINDFAERELDFPKDFKLLAFGFFLTIIIYWAGIQIIDFGWFIWRALT